MKHAKINSQIILQILVWNVRRHSIVSKVVVKFWPCNQKKTKKTYLNNSYLFSLDTKPLLGVYCASLDLSKVFDKV